MENLQEDHQTFFLKGPGYWNDDTLSNEQKEELEAVMFNIDADDEDYLRKHPEVEYIIAAVVMAAAKDRPTDALRFAVDYLSDEKLKERVMNQIQSYRLENVARQRLRDLEYGGSHSIRKNCHSHSAAGIVDRDSAVIGKMTERIDASEKDGAKILPAASLTK